MGQPQVTQAAQAMRRRGLPKQATFIEVSVQRPELFVRPTCGVMYVIRRVNVDPLFRPVHNSGERAASS
jgi:hypothetical protein